MSHSPAAGFIRHPASVLARGGGVSDGVFARSISRRAAARCAIRLKTCLKTTPVPPPFSACRRRASAVVSDAQPDGAPRGRRGRRPRSDSACPSLKAWTACIPQTPALRCPCAMPTVCPCCSVTPKAAPLQPYIRAGAVRSAASPPMPFARCSAAALMRGTSWLPSAPVRGAAAMSLRRAVRYVRAEGSVAERGFYTRPAQQGSTSLICRRSSVRTCAASAWLMNGFPTAAFARSAAAVIIFPTASWAGTAARWPHLSACPRGSGKRSARL